MPEQSIDEHPAVLSGSGGEVEEQKGGLAQHETRHAHRPITGDYSLSAQSNGAAGVNCMALKHTHTHTNLNSSYGQTGYI